MSNSVYVWMSCSQSKLPPDRSRTPTGREAIPDSPDPESVAHPVFLAPSCPLLVVHLTQSTYVMQSIKALVGTITPAGARNKWYTVIYIRTRKRDAHGERQIPEAVKKKENP